MRGRSTVSRHVRGVLHDLEAGASPLVVTIDGEAKAVLQSVGDFHTQQETMALLKLLAQAAQDIARGDLHDADAVFDEALLGLE